eukprot:3924053-Rhodomonas_salina.1
MPQRRPYAISGTDIPYGVILLRSRYAILSTDIRHDTISLRRPYAIPGTDLGYATTRETQGTEHVVRSSLPPFCF